MTSSGRNAAKIVSVDVEGRRMRVDRIDACCMDFGVGVLRGVLSRPELAHLDKRQVEAAIDNIRAAARLVDRIQRGDSSKKVKPRRRSFSRV